METHLEPLYEAYERLNKAIAEGDQELVLQIEEEMNFLRKKVVEDSKKIGSMSFTNFGAKTGGS